MKVVRTLRTVDQSDAIFKALWAHAKERVSAGHRLEIELRDETRSSAENALLHHMLTHIAKTQEWAGTKHSAETWKRLLTAAWCRATGQAIDLLPALDGHGVDVVYRRTSKLTVIECAELIEFINAWCANSGVDLPAYNNER